MKKDILKFKLLLLSILVTMTQPTQVVAQRTTKTYENIVEVSPDQKVFIIGPSTIRVSGRGAINARKIDDSYVVSGKSMTPYIYVINKNININTWNKSSVMQITTISLECENRSQEEALLKALKIEFDFDIKNNIHISCEMNIHRFNIKNAFFRKDDNSIQLTDGKSYKVKYLELTNEIYLPESVDVTINADHSDITIGNNIQRINCNLLGGSLTNLGSLHELIGDISSSKIDLSEVKSCNLELKNCSFNAKRIDDFQLSSSISKVEIGAVNHFSISRSLNDDVEIENLKSMQVVNALYSTFKIASISDFLDLDMKHGDLMVENVQCDLEAVKIVNLHGKISLPIGYLDEFLFKRSDVGQANYSMPDGFNKKAQKDFTHYFQNNTTSNPLTIFMNCKYCDVYLE